MANLLIQKGPIGNATTTVCHSRTRDLEGKLATADIVIAAVGVRSSSTARCSGGGRDRDRRGD